MTVRRAHRILGWRLLYSTLALVPGVGAAQLNHTEASIEGKVTATDNGAAAADGFEKSDVFTSVRPALRLSRRGAGLRADADIAADFVSSAKGTQRDRVLPDARASAGLTLVDQVLFLDTAVDLRQIEDNVFGPRVVEGTTQNVQTIGALRVSPYISTALSPGVNLQARLDETWVRVKDTIVGDSRTQRAVFRLEAEPRPLGWLVDATKEDTTFRDPQASDSALDRFSLTGTAAVLDDWVVGVAAGRERADFAGASQSDSTYGVRLFWVPSLRTDLAVAVDRRFFGDGWSLTARHRTPRMAIVVRGQREPTSAGTGIRGDSLATFLDAILTTRNPDPVQRAGLVDLLAAQRGLPERLQGPTAAAAAYVQLRTAASATWVFLGTRNTLSIGAYGEQRVRLEHENVAPTVPADDDSRQAGVSFDWNYRFTPQSSLQVGAAYSKIEGLGARGGERTRESSLRANWVQNLTPRLNATAGVNLRRLRTNVSTSTSFDQASVLFGLSHRF